MRIEELETPAVVVDLDIVEANLGALAAYTKSHNLQLRPHTKTHKIPELARKQIEFGAHGITVAKVGEAEIMAEAGLDNILIAYPVLGAAKLARLAAIARDRRILVAVDSPVTVEAISDAARATDSTIEMLVELDVGLRRCGVQSAAEVAELALKIERSPRLRFAGVNIFPGHIWATPGEQSEALAAVSSRLEETLDQLYRAGLSCEVVSGGSTPTAFNSHEVHGLTEIRPGTYVFNDRNTAGMGACTWDQCALRVMVTVVSTAVPGRAIIDGGSKTFSSDRWLSSEKTGFGFIPEHPEILFEAMSEEHGHLDISRAAYRPAVGEKLTVIPNHVCPCVNMHSNIYYHRQGIVEGSWTVAARGKVV